jgi:predicted glycoside hydrolase/deacetylase ChbG (UPF0249 family)
MAARLILNADDFGLTRGINRAIAELHEAGALTSATLMANGPAFDDAVGIARSFPSLGVGCHIVLTDGAPVLPPSSLPTLCPNGRTFRPRLTHFLRDLLLGRIVKGEIESESLAQVQKLQSAGIDVTHLDSHKHTHIFPPVAQVLIRILRRTSVAAIRNPFEPSHIHRHASLKRRTEIATMDAFQGRYDRIAGDALSTDGTFGISATGNLTPRTLRELLGGLPADGIYEILCHPGYNDAELDTITTRLRHHRDIEREALLREIPQIFSLPTPPELIHYGNLGAFGVLRQEGLFVPDTGFEPY